MCHLVWPRMLFNTFCLTVGFACVLMNIVFGRLGNESADAASGGASTSGRSNLPMTSSSCGLCHKRTAAAVRPATLRSHFRNVRKAFSETLEDPHLVKSAFNNASTDSGTVSKPCSYKMTKTSRTELKRAHPSASQTL